MRTLFFLLFSFVVLGLTACGNSYDNPPKVNAAQVKKYLNAQVAIGARYSASRGASQARDEIAASVSRPVIYQKFEDMTPEGKKLFVNLIVEVPGKSEEKFIVVGAHYDTKKMLSVPHFSGANDGASGVAALLAMISACPEKELPFSVRFVFFDGEESLNDYNEHDGLHGSRFYVRELVNRNETKNCKAMILLDMVGDTDLLVRFPADTTPFLLKYAENAAKKHGMEKHFQSGGTNMLDDHKPFQQNGIPAIDIIDFDYGPGNAYWHTDQDTLEHVSENSIVMAADFAFALIWEIAANSKD